MASSVFRFIWSVARHWGALVSGGVIIGLIGILQGIGCHIPPAVYWVIAIVAIFVACYMAWNEERIQKEKAIAELGELKLANASAARGNRSFSQEWKELSGKFEKVGLDASAQWNCNRRNNQTILETWSLSGTYRKPCETLCKVAGTMLLKSPNACLGMSEFARGQSDPVWRWLFFLKENHDAMSSNSPFGGLPPTDNEGTIYLMGRIPNLAQVSALVCTECAALEL